MNWWITTSGMFSLVTAAIHVFMGGPEVNAPVQSSDALAPEVRATMAVVWHAITAILVLSGYVKIYAGYSGRMRSTVVFIAAQYIALTVLFMALGFSRFGSLWALPQWSLFVVILGCLGMGLRKSKGADGMWGLLR